ncbi:hypothetical protein AB0C31_40785, partial [Actinoplanes philippinensis]
PVTSATGSPATTSPATATPVPAAPFPPTGPTAVTAAPGRPPRRRRTVAVAATAVAVLLATAVGVLIRYNGLSSPDRTAGGPGGGSASAPASGAASATPAASPNTGRTPTAEERLHAIKTGKNRTLIHVAEIDRDLALEDHYVELGAGDGTGPKSEFALIPMGVDYMIRSLYDPAGDEVCLGIRLKPDASAKVVSAKCETSVGTLFELIGTKLKDDKNRPRFHIYNDTYGFLQWDADANEGTGGFYVEQVGDAPPLTTFSFVDRGPLPSPSPS